MGQRIFIAVNLPEDIKKELNSFRDKCLELPARWTKTENLHITLVFLGYVADEELLEVCKIVRETALKYKPFVVKLDKIIYGPVGKPARMVWAEGEKSEELGKLQRDLENALAGSSSQGNGKSYAPHITLARIKEWEFRRLEPEERPEINEEINLNFEVNSIEVMESELKKGGPDYAVLESCPLKS